MEAKPTKYILRYPNWAGMKRGPNMMREICQWCAEYKTHGFKLVDDSCGDHLSTFVCDDCLSQARKEQK